MVKQSQVIHRLMNAFRSANELDESSRLSFYFDGEELDPHSTVASYDMGDMDTLDVYMKS
jgi:Ubiquitin-2 like Rad60 SUMO-like